MRWKSFPAVCFMILSMVIACGSDYRNKSEAAGNVSDIPAHYKRELEYLNFEIEHIEIDLDDSLYQTYAKRVEFDPKSTAKFFLGDSFQGTISKNEDGVFYLTQGEKLLYFSGDNMVYMSNSKEQSNVAKNFSVNEDGNKIVPAHIYAEFTDKSLQAEKKRLEKQVQEIGIENLELYKCYDLGESMYWSGIQKCQGIPVFTTIYYEGMNDEWMPFQFLNTQEGMEMAKVIYCFRFEQKKEKIKLLSFDEIAKSLEQEYEMILTDNKYDVVGAELYFWVDVNQEDAEYKMEPVWVFTIHEYREGEEENYNEYQELIHAETGKSVEVKE